MIKFLLFLRVMYWEMVEFKSYANFRLHSGWKSGDKLDHPTYDIYSQAASRVRCALEDYKYGKPMYLYPSSDERIYRRNPKLKPHAFFNQK